MRRREGLGAAIVLNYAWCVIDVTAATAIGGPHRNDSKRVLTRQDRRVRHNLRIVHSMDDVAPREEN